MRTKSKHVIAKRLKDGTVAYYWNAPPWFRQLHNDIPASLPLGDDLKEAKETINALNASVEKSRRAQRKLKWNARVKEVRKGLGIARTEH
jgi:hypothetical protein